MSKSDKQWEKVEQLIDEIESVGNRHLSKAEKTLISMLMDGLSNFQNKDIQPGVNLTDIINDVMDAFEQKEMRPIVEFISKEIVKTVESISEYFRLHLSGTNVIDTTKSVEAKILKSYGLERTKDGVKIVSKGYLDSLTNNPEIRSNIQKIVLDAAFGETSFSNMMRNISAYVEGTATSEGAIRRHFKTMAFDTVSLAARAQEDMVATDLGMQAFIFTGKQLETSRCFCKNRKGKVILVSEAMEGWPKLLNQKCGPIWSDKLEYKPLENMGGHACVDHKRYITNAEAMRRDKTIRLNETTGELYRVAA